MRLSLAANRELKPIEVFRKPNVFVCPTGKINDPSAIPGVLSLTVKSSKEDTEVTFMWTSLATAAKLAPQLSLSTPFFDLVTGQTVPSGTSSRANAAATGAPADPVVTPKPASPAPAKKPSTADSYEIAIPLKKIRSIKKHQPAMGAGTPFIIVQTADNVFLPPLFFQAGGVKELFKTLKEFVSITQSSEDSNLIYLNDLSNPLAMSLSALDVHGGNTTLAIFGASATFHTETPGEESAQEGSLFHNISMAVLGKLSKVPKMGREAIKLVTSPAQKEDVISKPSSVHYSLGSFELLDDADHMLSLPEVKRESNPYSAAEWSTALDAEGRVLNPVAIKDRIFRAGCEKSIRKEVWKYLLNYYPWNSTTAERAAIRTAREAEYLTYKKQWQTITKDQEAHFGKFRARRGLVEKDTLRTDRDMELFRQRESTGLRAIHDILVTYTFFNFDLGYVQGMNDLLSPIYLIMQDEVDAFWCFKGYMDVMESNFNKDQNGMTTQFYQLEKLLYTVDPELHAYFQEQQALNLYFCYRWLLVNFKREFTPETVQDLWEVVWANPLHPRFHLFIAVGILTKHRTQIIGEKLGFDRLLKFVNDMSGNLNANEILARGEAVYKLFDVSTDDEVKANIFQFKPAVPKRK